MSAGHSVLLILSDCRLDELDGADLPDALADGEPSEHSL